MFNFDSTITIPAIIALVATIPPIITAIINNLFLIGMKKLEIKQKHYKNTVLHKREIIENYIMSLSSCVTNSERKNIDEYGKYHAIAYMYMPDCSHETMTKVYQLAKHDCWDEIAEYIDELSNYAYDTIKTLKI